ncbi:polyamine-modulated factor 1 isoform X2 [Halictus rubicundus]|uniref:polyamine-modulated factor 1 isoform X2 n=1 Tax=Halictus rubicundus TaxID=77578 RepID=UPI0040360FBE
MEEDQEHKYSNNAYLFRLGISNSFKSIAESVSMDAFSNILTILKSKPNVTQKLHAAMVKELHDGMIRDLEFILNDGHLQESLEKLQKLYDADLSLQEDAWRPPGNVALHLRSLDAQAIKEESVLLAERVVKMEEENAILMKDILEKRSKVSALHDTITQTLNRTPNTIELLQNRLEDLEECITLLEHE